MTQTRSMPGRWTGLLALLPLFVGLGGCATAIHALVAPGLDSAMGSLVEANATPESMGVTTTPYRGKSCAELGQMLDLYRKEQAKPGNDGLARKTAGWQIDALQTVQYDQGCTPAGAAAGKVVPTEMKMYFYCYAWEESNRVNTRGLRKSMLTVTTNVFERTVSFTDPMHQYNLVKAFTDEFRIKVMPLHDLGKTEPTCMFEDNAVTMNKARVRLRDMIGVGISTTNVDVAWQPTSTVQPAAPSAPKPPATAAAAANTGLDVAALGARVEALKDKKAKGALVASVAADGPAAKAGLKPKDVVTHVAGQAIGRPQDVDTALAQLRAGAKAPVQVRRGGKALDLSVQLAGAPVVAAAAPVAPAALSVAAPSATKACVAFVFKGNTTPPKEGVQARFDLPRSDLPRTEAAFDGFMAFVVRQEPDRWGKGFETRGGCVENFCSANTVRTFGTRQMAFMVCQNSQQDIDKAFPYLRGSESPLRTVVWTPD